MARDLPFIDAHAHLWDLDRIAYPWLTPPFADDGPNGSVAPIARTYLLDDYLADAEGWDVRGIVHVDAGADASAALAETAWLQGLHDARGMPNAIVAFAALDDPGVEALLDAHAAHHAVRGIRHIVNWHADPRRSYTPRDVTQDEAWARGFALLGKYQLSFDLQAYPGQFPGLAKLIAQHPETQIIINHAGMAVPGEWEQWRAGMAALAALPNVATKLSGMGFTHRPWSVDQARAYILEAIDLFGTDRAMFASDFPTDKLFGSFAQHLDAYDAITADFSDGERRALWGRNADRIYRLGLDI
ncbi:putative TIM-barrel fold metal-dependent hydrolase [Sphingomonas naasensis]|uniref:Amidohydrolase n=1 Tax=Sphingomonas naasensis TaxID=1344951 RepID=A0A4S1WCJ5_9SPHN|nr:amidohydrolase family protein [Sphingomonas naasensis]NIJ22429.1 putative TIM-barrel fold metal-dependent hydrolase [Sphingomonas naasensis]TGX40589.1 amidohydrolase [Sphingomonas naasensis]